MEPVEEDRPGIHRNVWVTSGTSFLTDISSEMILNVLPLFLANVLGVRIWAVGLVEGLADTTAALVKVVSGRLSDRTGARKWLAVAGYVVSTLAKPFYLVVTTWTGVAAIRWGDRVGKGVRTAPRDALLADSSAPARRGLVFGIHRAADTGGAVIGLLITLAVVGRMQGDASLLEDGTFRTLVLWSLLPAALGVILLATAARDVEVSGDPSSRQGRDAAGLRRTPSGRSAFRELGGGFRWFVIASVLFELGNSADALIVLRAQERGLSVMGVLWILLAFNVVYAAVAAPAGAVSDRLGRRGTVFVGWVVYCVAYLGFAFAESTWHITVLYLLYGVYHGVVAGAAKALVVALVPARLRATAFGTYAAVVGVVGLPASLLGGVLWEGFGGYPGLGPAAPFAFGSLTAALAAVVLVVMVPEGA